MGTVNAPLTNTQSRWHAKLEFFTPYLQVLQAGYRCSDQDMKLPPMLKLPIACKLHMYYHSEIVTIPDFWAL